MSEIESSANDAFGLIGKLLSDQEAMRVGSTSTQMCTKVEAVYHAQAYVSIARIPSTHAIVDNYIIDQNDDDEQKVRSNAKGLRVKINKIPLTLPDGLKNLTFGGVFNQPVNALTLPNGLQSLSFEDAFDQPVNALNLPAGLHSLTFGDAFD